MKVFFIVLSAVLSTVAFGAPSNFSHVDSRAVSSGISLAGVNIAGFDFGCDTNGNCPLSGTYPPLASIGNPDGVGQMQHLRSIGLNAFRLPVSWQWLVNNDLGGPLDQKNSDLYDELVGSCLATGAHCIIDIHNYARWNGQIVDQSGGAVTGSQLNSLWSQLALKHANNPSIIFGLMNEPHDLDIDQWATTVQGVINTIRNTLGNQDQVLLLPGTDYTAAGTFISTGSYSALSALTNPDGSSTNLVFDIHQYLDGAGGTTPTCVTNGIDGNFEQLATQLRQDGRQAFLTETGGGSTDSCDTDLCAELSWMADGNGDVFLGWVGWAAGSFEPYPGYALGLTPTFVNGAWVDVEILTSCILGAFVGPN